MIRVRTNSELRAVQSLPFCYICGEGFLGRSDRTRDHVPAKSIFSASGRRDPLVLPAHRECNNSFSCDDEKIGQLLGLGHKRIPKPKNFRLDVGGYRSATGNVRVAGIRNLPLPEIIARWIRGFHAALYADYLPVLTEIRVHTPLPSGRPVDGKVRWDRVMPQHPMFVEMIKKNRKAGRIDQVACFDRECIYESVWEKTDDGRWCCIFALDICDWSKLADQTTAPKRGCVGFYMPENGKPASAAEGVTGLLEIPIPSGDPLDPFDGSS